MNYKVKTDSFQVNSEWFFVVYCFVQKKVLFGMNFADKKQMNSAVKRQNGICIEKRHAFLNLLPRLISVVERQTVFMMFKRLYVDKFIISWHK